jgi:hypothetical protein
MLHEAVPPVSLRRLAPNQKTLVFDRIETGRIETGRIEIENCRY